MKPSLVAVSVAFTLTLAACGSGNGNSTPPGGGSATSVPTTVAATQGASYTLSVWAEAPGTLRPDDLLLMGSNVFVVYQDNNINPDGTLVAGVKEAQSEVIEYDLYGNVVHTFKVPGHPDGLVAFNSSTVWVSTNEDANPEIIAINTKTNAMSIYTSDVATLPSGGGLDDMKVVNGVVYASASNPTLTTTPSPNLTPYSTDASGSTAANGVNVGPAVLAVTLNSDGKTFHVTPALMSNIPATLLPAGTPIGLNMTDPDSSAIDPSGDLVIVSQQDSELVFIKGVSTATATASVLPLTMMGNYSQIDDIRWPPAKGNSFMLLSDNSGQFIYRIDAAEGFGTKYAYAAGETTVNQVDLKTGIMTPIYVGMKSPHDLIFVPE